MKSVKTLAPLPVLREETRRQIDAFVVGFQSAKTRSNYRANLRAWFCWTGAGDVGGLEVKRAHVEAYVRDLEAAGYAPNTICQRIATLASFYRWAVSNGKITSNPIEGARRPRKPAESTAHGLSLNRPGFRGGSDLWRGWSHASTQQVPGGDPPAGSTDGVRVAGGAW